MKNNPSGRRHFMKSAAGLTGLAFGNPNTEISTTTNQIKKLKIVCVGAHPGDPEFGCGGTMAKYTDAGHDVTFLYLTRGEASDPTKSHQEMAALRTAEAGVACGILKSKAAYVGQIDGDTSINKQSNVDFQKILSGYTPNVVFSQWPVDSHGDHQVAGLLALNAWSRSERKFHLYFYEVNTGSETMVFTPTDYVDITTVRERKKQALFAHKTQDPVNTYDKYFEPLEEFRGLEAGVTAAEAFIHFKPQRSNSMIGLS